jgi:hemoglobin-like flavoprotein
VEAERAEAERAEAERAEAERAEAERAETENTETAEVELAENDQVEAESEAPLTEYQVKLIQDTWEMLAPVKEQTAALFYKKLFLVDPKIKPLFKADMTSQGEKLITAINLVVNSLNNLEQVVPALKELGERHASYGVQPAHYDTVGGALLWTFEQSLGDAFTAEAKEAWTVAYGLIASTMKAGVS